MRMINEKHEKGTKTSTKDHNDAHLSKISTWQFSFSEKDSESNFSVYVFLPLFIFLTFGYLDESMVWGCKGIIKYDMIFLPILSNILGGQHWGWCCCWILLTLNVNNGGCGCYRGRPKIRGCIGGGGNTTQRPIILVINVIKDVINGCVIVVDKISNVCWRRNIRWGWRSVMRHVVGRVKHVIDFI